MPILNPEKPKRITLTMANTMFGAMSGVQPVNWGMLIHEVVGRAIPHIGRKPSYLSPFILHLYKHYECIRMDEEDLLTIASEEVAYKLHPTVADTSTSIDPIIPTPSLPGSPPPSFRNPTLRHLPLRIIIRKPDLAVTRLGGTWIYPPGIFRRIPSNGSTMSWQISNPVLPAGAHHQGNQPSIG